MNRRSIRARGDGSQPDLMYSKSMVSSLRKQAAKKFVEYWTFNRPGSEKSGCQQFWNMLLRELLGQTELESIICYEVPVLFSTARGAKHEAQSTKYLDAWIPSTRVLIEQKSRGVKLDAPQPGHDNMTPFEQAKFYDDHRPFDEKARWIITCNFDEIWIYDQTKSLDPPEKITLGSLPKEAHRLAFLVNTEVKKVAKRELEISVQAGKIVGTLCDAANVFIQNRGGVHYPWLPKMSKGSQPTDGGNLILSPAEREEIILSHPEASAFILQYISAEDFINNKLRYCLWLKGVAPNLYRSIPEVMRRLDAVVEMRRKSPTKSVQRDAETPMLFTQIRQPTTNYLVVPEVSSERRRYVPIGFVQPNVIASNMLYIVPDASLFMFGVLISSVHMAWARTVAGRLKSDYRYTPAVYNNFPWPDFASSLRSTLATASRRLCRCITPCGEENECANDKNGQTGFDIAEYLCGEPVARLTGHEFEGLKGVRAIVSTIYDSYARVNWTVNHSIIGEILLTKSGINDSMRHGFGRFKLAAFEKIPEIISNGVIALHSPNWKSRGYESFVVAAPILIANEPCCAFVVINSVKEGGHRFYLHEVGRLADIKEKAEELRAALSSQGGEEDPSFGTKEKSGGLRSGSSDCSALSSTPGSIKSLAFSIFGVKGAVAEGRDSTEGRSVSAVSDESESAKRQIEKTAQGILDARALYPDSSLADLYDPLTMPPELRKAHAGNDVAVLKAYGWSTDLSEPEIVSRLFDMYEKLTRKTEKGMK